jgi:hypothetical protein
MIIFTAALIALLAADRIEAQINSNTSIVTFTFFSTVFLGLLILIPESTAVVAALVAATVSSLTRRQQWSKRLVNTFSMIVTILCAAGAYTIFGGGTLVTAPEVLSIVAAGIVFSIVNFISLAAFIALATRQSLFKELKNYYVVVVLEMLPPIIAGMAALLANISPITSLALLVIMTLLFRPQYDVMPRKVMPKARWNITPYKDILSIPQKRWGSGE